MTNQQTILDTIHIQYDSFFEQEKKIANYILNNYKDVINMTIGELSEDGKVVSEVSFNMTGVNHLD